MSSDSVFGGNTDLTSTVSSQSISLIDKFLTDTVGGSSTSVSVGSSTLVVGSGHDGEKQGALLPTNSVVSGSIDDGVLKLDVALPANKGFVFEGKDHVTPDTVSAFLGSVIDSYVPPGAPGSSAEVLRASLYNAVSDLVTSMKALGVNDVVVRMVDFVSHKDAGGGALRAAVSPGEVLFDTSATHGNEMFAFNLAGLSAGETLVLQGVENAVLSGAGTVRVEGSAGVHITSDSASQQIIGGSGADTLIGGGGNDTLTGGAGNDVFAFSHKGNFEITDFSVGDKIAFNVPGVTDLAQLAPLVSQVTEDAHGVTYHFGNDASITLVGHVAADFTVGMLDFTF